MWCDGVNKEENRWKLCSVDYIVIMLLSLEIYAETYAGKNLTVKIIERYEGRREREGQLEPELQNEWTE